MHDFESGCTEDLSFPSQCRVLCALTMVDRVMGSTFFVMGTMQSKLANSMANVVSD